MSSLEAFFTILGLALVTVLTRGFLEIAQEGEDTLIIQRFAKDGLDVFGQPLLDEPYTLRVTRDAIRL